MVMAAIPAAIAVAQMISAHNNQPGQAAAPGGISGLAPSIQTAQQGVQANIGNQNAFAQALQTQMNGGGPNLAGSLLSNASGQNVQNQAALMAGQRGTGSNAGLIARQAAQQGAGIQQNAIGQAAALRQQQQLNAQQGLANTYGQIGQEQGQNLSSNLSAATGQNQQTVQTNQINAQTGLANANNQNAQMAGIGQALPGIASTLTPAKTDINNNMFANPSSPSTGAGAVSIPGVGPGYAQGGSIEQLQDFSSPLPDHLQTVADIFHPSTSVTAHNAYNPSTNQYAKGGTVPALVSPGEKEIKPKDVKKIADGKADPMSVGKTIPGKPKVPGAVNSYDNDTIPKKLAVGSIILPRSVTQSKDPGKDASAFVLAIINKKKNKGGK